MQINWLVRLKNPVWVTGFVAVIVAFIYQICGMFDIVPPISQDQIVQMSGLIINMLIAVGVMVDPTTAGVRDSDLAITYDRPRAHGEPIDREVQ